MASSAGYAQRLSRYDNKGVCGLPEIHDNERVLKRKLAKLTKLVKESKYIVVLTGAGVSTSTGIPDFRGPRGIWTIEKNEEKAEKKKRKRKNAATSSQKEKLSADQVEGNKKDLAAGKDSAFYNSPSKAPESLKRKRDDKSAPLSFEAVKPSLTHRAITFLANRDIVKYCVTQNVDGLHRRSGLSRSKHSALHGCVFTEKCEKCGMEYFRDFDVGGVSFKKTGRKCSDNPGCNGDLRDTILDWDDALPEDDWERAQTECSKADLVLSLGTSLRIEPAGLLPLRAKRFVIVNLQKTPVDKDATLTIGAGIDGVMAHVMNALEFGGWEDETDN